MLPIPPTVPPFNTDLKRRAGSTVSELKEEVARLWGVPAGRQKLMFRGLVKDDAATLDKARH